MATKVFSQKQLDRMKMETLVAKARELQIIEEQDETQPEDFNREEIIRQLLAKYDELKPAEKITKGTKKSEGPKTDSIVAPSSMKGVRGNIRSYIRKAAQYEGTRFSLTFEYDNGTITFEFEAENADETIIYYEDEPIDQYDSYKIIATNFFTVEEQEDEAETNE